MPICSFHDYLKSRELVARDTLRKLFDILDQKDNKHDPQLYGEPLRIILEEMGEDFDWSSISPTIFRTVFE